ncbi:PqqD family protein [Sporolactobacillus shoreae]|uniref:PqqD family protein n=2 Tax=Sporolactobacillus shoreae TaxID=1465501 RepID=A0A4Z0GUP8_9BACL|nr:PqqD family protein [Sporolactobacillus shoreae]
MWSVLNSRQGDEFMEAYYIKKKNCETVQVDDEDNIMIINLDDSTVTNLNRAGGKCWSLLNEKQSADTLAHSLLRGEESPSSEQEDINHLRAYIQSFLDQMVDCGLVRNA